MMPRYDSCQSLPPPQKKNNIRRFLRVPQSYLLQYWNVNFSIILKDWHFNSNTVAHGTIFTVHLKEKYKLYWTFASVKDSCPYNTISKIGVSQKPQIQNRSIRPIWARKRVYVQLVEQWPRFISKLPNTNKAVLKKSVSIISPSNPNPAPEVHICHFWLKDILPMTKFHA